MNRRLSRTNGILCNLQKLENEMFLKEKLKLQERIHRAELINLVSLNMQGLEQIGMIPKPYYDFSD